MYATSTSVDRVRNVRGPHIGVSAAGALPNVLVVLRAWTPYAEMPQDVALRTLYLARMLPPGDAYDMVPDRVPT